MLGPARRHPRCLRAHFLERRGTVSSTASVVVSLLVGLIGFLDRIVGLLARLLAIKYTQHSCAIRERTHRRTHHAHSLLWLHIHQEDVILENNTIESKS